MPTRRTVLAALTATALSTAVMPFEALAQQIANVGGIYSAFGMNQNGSKYSGQVQIVQRGTSVELFWSIGGQSYSGRGFLDGRVMSVDWGAATPVIYVLVGRELHGTWDNGTALEKLVPQ